MTTTHTYETHCDECGDLIESILNRWEVKMTAGGNTRKSSPLVKNLVRFGSREFCSPDCTHQALTRFLGELVA